MLNSIAITSFIFTNNHQDCHQNHHRGVHLGIIIKIHHHDCHQHQHHHRGEVTLASLSPKLPPRRSFGHHNLFQPPSISSSRNSPGHGIHCATLHPEHGKAPLLSNQHSENHICKLIFFNIDSIFKILMPFWRWNP